MKCLYQILLPLLGLFFYRVELTEFLPLKLDVIDYQVLDGDTVVVRVMGKKESVRLIPIDAPEKGQPFLKGRGDAGEFSKQCLEKILTQKRIKLLWGKRDMYGRVLGEFEANGVNVSKLMIQNGCAVLYVYSQFSSKTERAEWLRLQQISQRQKVGIWSRGMMSPYHYRKIKKKIRIRF